jgi:predicted CopG family antitoxin
MSTKTIAVDSTVYERLAKAKLEGESFSKTIDRLLELVGSAHTGASILGALSAIPTLSDRDSEVFLRVIDENRADEEWPRNDLR